MSRTAVRIPRSGRAQRGMTLIELMVALALSVFVMSAVGYAYVTQRGLHRHKSAVAELQTGVQLAMEMLGNDLRQAGYVGCNSNLQRATLKERLESVILPLRDPATVGPGVENFTIDATNALRVFNASAPVGTWGGTKPANVVADSHVIEIRYASADGASLLATDINPAGTLIQTMTEVDLGRGDAVPTSLDRLGILSDCASGMVVHVDNVTGTNVHTPTDKVDFARCAHPSQVGGTCFYWPATMLMPVRVVQYYVDDAGTVAAPNRRLMMRKRVMTVAGITWNPPQVVIDGVRTLRVASVGLDNANPDDTMFRATREVGEATSMTAVETLPPAEWARVVRLDVRLSMQSRQQVGVQADRVYRNFESSFAIRSRVSQEPKT